MAETAPIPAAVAPAKGPKKKSTAKAKKAGTVVGELIVKAVSSSKDRSGVSLAALKKALVASGYDVEKNNSRVKIAIKNMVTKGTLVQVKGIGASGSFKLNKQQAETKKKAVPKEKTSTAKKPDAAKKLKSSPAKKPAAKKSSKKVKKLAAVAVKTAKKSPGKAKKPAAAKKAVKIPKRAKAAKPKASKPKKAAPKKK